MTGPARVEAVGGAGLGSVSGPDGLLRCPWATASDLERDYHDTEWGTPVQGEAAWLERMTLEGFQSGLSWRTILAKRPAFREVFADFDADTVAGFGPDDVERLMTDARIVRNRAKILATIGNARATLALREDPDLPGDLPQLLWSFQPASTPAPMTVAEVPTKSAESAALARELKRRGFRFVGPTTAYALMEAVGMVDTHLVGSWRRGTSGVW